jgi:uncharacterized protein YciI
MSSEVKSQTNGKRYIYFYFNRNEEEKIVDIVPKHIQYWQAAAVNDYLGGPFSDHTGGLISFSVASLQIATNIILKDPFITEGLIAQKWIKEWETE